MEDLKISSNENNKNFYKYIKPCKIKFYPIDNLIDKNKLEDLTCPICLQILINPVSCSDNMNSHSFCKDCIDEFLKEKKRIIVQYANKILHIKLKIKLLKN